MRKLLVLGATFIILVQIPGWATATSITFDQNLKTYMRASMNACAWAFTRAHKKPLGTSWFDEHNVTGDATCTTDGVNTAQSTPADAIHVHAPTNDQIHASADATCDSPACASFTMHNPIAVVSKPHSVAAGSYTRGGVPGTPSFSESGTGVLKGPTVVISGKVADLSSGTDPYESVLALAITDQALGEWNLELAQLLDITDPPNLPARMCMAPPTDPDAAHTHCGNPKHLKNIKFQTPGTTYFKLVVNLRVNGQLDVQTSGPGKIAPAITEQDFQVKSVTCTGANETLPLKAQKAHECFKAEFKGTGLNHEIMLMPNQNVRQYPEQITIDLVNGIVAKPPFE